MTLLALASLALAGPAPAVMATDSPRIEFASTVHDFGKIKLGDVVKHSFVFTNTGKALLEISDVRPGCGCTTAGTWDKKVEPGKTGIIPLQFNSLGFSGTVTKSATVTCNDPAHTNVVLRLIAAIWKPIEVTPSMVLFSLSDEVQTNITKVIRITNHLEEPLVLSDLVNTNRSFRAELKTVKPGKEFDLEITALPPFTARTTLAPIRLKTSSPQMASISVSAYAMVQPAVSASPEQLWIPATPIKSPVKSSLLIRNVGTHVVTLSEPRANVPGVEVKLVETQPGRLFSLQVSFATGFKMEADQKVEIAVNSTNPRHPVIRVPVFQQAAPRPISSVPNATAPATLARPGLPEAPVRPIPPTSETK